jgi:hypothetical protein
VPLMRRCPCCPPKQVEKLRTENRFLEDQLQRALKELKAFQVQVRNGFRSKVTIKIIVLCHTRSR